YQQVKRVPGKHAALLSVAPPPSNTPLPAPASFGSKQLSIGFYIDWDEPSYSSLERNLNKMDWLMPQCPQLVAPAKPGSRPNADDLTGADSGFELVQAFYAL